MRWIKMVRKSHFICPPGRFRVRMRRTDLRLGSAPPARMGDCVCEWSIVIYRFERPTESADSNKLVDVLDTSSWATCNCTRRNSSKQRKKVNRCSWGHTSHLMRVFFSECKILDRRLKLPLCHRKKLSSRKQLNPHTFDIYDRKLSF